MEWRSIWTLTGTIGSGFSSEVVAPFPFFFSESFFGRVKCEVRLCVCEVIDGDLLQLPSF